MHVSHGYRATGAQEMGRPKSKLHRLLASAIVAIMFIFSALLVTASPASAATDYGINMNVACHYTYNGPQYSADFYNFADPFSWNCRTTSWSAGVPSGVSVTNSSVGGVDIQKYCGLTYRGSRAVIVYWNAWGWRCRR